MRTENMGAPPAGSEIAIGGDRHKAYSCYAVASPAKHMWTPFSSSKPKGFFAYATAPHSVPPTISAAIEGINRTQQAELTSWESLSIGGKFVADEVCDAIDDHDFFCADVTSVNPNVMFELGFAIARDKRIWLVRDNSYVDSRSEFEQLRLLTTVGYRQYTNAENIIKSFFADQPHKSLEDTIFRQSIDPLLSPTEEPDKVLYLKSFHDTEASVRVSRVMDNLTSKPMIDDPRESSVQPLYWYAQNALSAPGVLVHFLNSQREGSRAMNAKYAFVSGLARGFDRPLLMLTELQDVLAPMDYRDLMEYYTTPSEAARLTQEWIAKLKKASLITTTPAYPSHGGAVKLATELKDFHQKLGEYVAENEADSLPQYFVETTAHMDILNGTQTIFVGRKGSGKTANLIQASHELGKDISNLVCILKPVGYEMETLSRLFASYKEKDRKGYVIESLWKYMLYTELALAVVHQIERDAPWLGSDPSARKLINIVSVENRAIAGDFSVRLERAVSDITQLSATASEGQFRTGISEVLHSNLLSQLRSSLSEVLSRKHKVLLLIDNLDKPWTRSADLEQLTHFLLGLLTAAERIGEELRHGEKGRNAVRFNSAIFLRSDIFNRLIDAANEPDKISHNRLTWTDPELLLRVIEERYIASHGRDADPAVMWRGYFCSNVKGIPTRDYFAARILPRPRDIVYFIKAAVSFAVNRKHDRVEAKDILDAEMQYSQYAWDSILVENSSTIPKLDEILLAFVGGDTILRESTLKHLISSTGLEIEKVDQVISQLISLTFLGVEVGRNKFAYADERKELQKNLILASRYASARGEECRYEINAPFRAYLEVSERPIADELF